MQNNNNGVRRIAIIASKGTLDMAYPPLTLATTAASMGWEAGIFFTFYGLDIIHRKRQHKLAVSPVGNPAMPPPLKGVPLKMPTMMAAMPGMTAAATGMMRSWMKRANMATLPELLEMARELGVRFFACNSTIGIMGIEPDDLIDGVERAGAPTFLDFAAEADVQLFI